MNSSLSGMKFKVGGLFKAAYRWFCEEETPPPPQTAVPPPPAPAPPPPPPAEPPPPPVETPVVASEDSIQLPLQPVLDTLPPQLKAKLRQPVPGNLTFPVPVAKIMAQLPQGSVQITFGELRLAATGVFLLSTDCDQMMVSLPLAEILPRINLACFARRDDQKAVEVPPEISSPFDGRGQGLKITETTPGTPPAARTAMRGSVFSSLQPPSARPAPTRPIGMPRREAPPRRSDLSPPPVQRPVSPPTPLSPSPCPPLPSAVAYPGTERPPAGTPVTRPSGGNGAAGAHHPPINRMAATPSADAGAIPMPGTPAVAPVSLPLSALAQHWPQAVQSEIVQLNLTDATVVMPADLLEQGLRRGKLCFPWKMLRHWVQPAVASPETANDDTVLELPLSIVAPLYMARRSALESRQRKVAVDESIPNLFFGFPQPEASPGIGPVTSSAASVPAPAADTNYYVWNDDRQAASPGAVAETPEAPIHTDFTRRRATPNEIVTRAAELEGVDGALVALGDGLTVAHRVPPQINPDTLAAFLPQIFTKVSHCTRELRMGELNNLSFTVGNIPWKIFRVHGVFFAAFGRAGAGLPSAQLAPLAAELDRKPQAA
ncbi:MAG TPA: hypothetical protein PK236_08085 [Verrucomicrobiota bacterium]|mgnify:CR=1 FL=1|nr:hypothetical protein [Verrucomicrobiota bacterium]